MTELTDGDLDAIENRVAAASAAPWESFIFSDRNPNDADFIRVGEDDCCRDMYVEHEVGADRTPRGKTLSSSLTHDRTFQRWSLRFAS
jgi:hypothetical protein